MRSATNAVTLIKTPINFPSWNHLSQLRLLLDQRGEPRPLAFTKAYHAGACKLLPLKKADERAAAATLKNPSGEQWYGSAAAVLHYNCVSRAIAFACRILEIPCVRYFDDFGIIAPSCLIDQSLEAFKELNEAFLVELENANPKLVFFWNFWVRGDGQASEASEATG